MPILEYLTTPTPTSWSKPLRTPIYQLQAYLDLRERHEGASFDREAYLATIDWPATPSEASTSSSRAKKIKVPIDTDDPCKVYLKLTHRRDKTIKVELLSDLWDLHLNYYSKSRCPPIQKVVRAYRRHGYEKELLDEILRRQKSNETARKEYVEGLISRVFPEKTKPSAKKKEKEKVKRVDDEDVLSGDDVSDDDSDTNDTWDDDDNAFDMEIDDDADVDVDENECDDSADEGGDVDELL